MRISDWSSDVCSSDLAEYGLSNYFFLSAWAALYLAFSYASEVRRFERRAARYEQAAQKAELRSLRYQVNNHFLFNTLNSLSSLIMMNRTEAEIGRAPRRERVCQYA